MIGELPAILQRDRDRRAVVVREAVRVRWRVRVHDDFVDELYDHRVGELGGRGVDRSTLLIRFLRAVTRARAEGEQARIRQVEELTNGGQVIEERTEETFNEKTGVRRVVMVRRLTPGDWRGHGGKGMDCLEIVQQAYELSHTRAPDPRALSRARRPTDRGQSQAGATGQASMSRQRPTES